MLEHGQLKSDRPDEVDDTSSPVLIFLCHLDLGTCKL